MRMFSRRVRRISPPLVVPPFTGTVTVCRVICQLLVNRRPSLDYRRRPATGKPVGEGEREGGWLAEEPTAVALMPLPHQTGNRYRERCAASGDGRARPALPMECSRPLSGVPSDTTTDGPSRWIASPTEKAGTSDIR